MHFAQLRANLTQKSYCEIPLAISPEDIANLMRHFFDFLSLPQDVKNHFSLDIKLDTEDRGTELGYRRRTGENGYDNKEFFHYNNYINDAFPRSDFLVCADHVYRQALAAMQDMMRILETKYPGIYDRFFPVGQHPMSLLRILRYNKSQQGDFIAKGHYDRSSCTIAIAESAPGLRIGLNDQHLTEVAHRNYYGLFFPGLALGKYTNSELSPSWHDVIQKEVLAYHEHTSRWAIVFFCVAPESTHITRAMAHTPLSC